MKQRVSSLDRSPHRGHHHSGGGSGGGSNYHPSTSAGAHGSNHAGGGTQRSHSAERLHRSGSRSTQPLPPPPPLGMKASPLSSTDGCSPPDKGGHHELSKPALIIHAKGSVTKKRSASPPVRNFISIMTYVLRLIHRNDG